jgi:hypothetical protein
MTDIIQTAFHGHAEGILQELRRSESGAHFLIVYPNLQTLREMYSHYTKSALFEGNEIVVILPFYEIVDDVRRILSESDANIDIRKHRKRTITFGYGFSKGLFWFTRRFDAICKANSRVCQESK